MSTNVVGWRKQRRFHEVQTADDSFVSDNNNDAVKKLKIGNTADDEPSVLETTTKDTVSFTPTARQLKRFGTRCNPTQDLHAVESEKKTGRQRHLRLQARLNNEAVRRLAASELLLTETKGYLKADSNEKTFRLSQKDILAEVDTGTQEKAFELSLSFGPYKTSYTKNGRYLLMAGRQGSLSILDCHKLSPITEFNVKETVRDVTFFHDHTLWAAAQKKYVYIYDSSGLELHCLREHMLTYAMEFLPYHFLLSTIGEFGELRWIDVSTGLVPASYKTKQGPCDVMCQNPDTAVISLGHTKGSVSMWTPNVGKPVVQFLGHKGKITALKHFGQNYLATAGVDGYWKVWDLRKYESTTRHRYYGGTPKSIDASQSGLLGIGFGPHIQIWNNPTHEASLYLSHETHGAIVESIGFQPYEDFLCIGSDRGLETIVVPGSCFANFDSYAADPYETRTQRREREVHQLLDKLPASTITFNPERLGGLDEAPETILLEEETAKKTELEIKKSKKHREKNTTKAVAREKSRRKKYTELVVKKKERDLREEQLREQQENADEETTFKIKRKEPIYKRNKNKTIMNDDV